MTHKHLSLRPNLLSFATDFYQLTMMYAYHGANMDAQAGFELFVRRFPKNRRFLISAGLEQVLAFVRELRFDGEQIDYLRQHPAFVHADQALLSSFFERLRGFRFGGNIRAIPEGTVFFPNEPVIQVEGSLLEGQLIETFALSAFNYQTIVASKAARIRLTAPNKKLADFGTRRGHSPLAGAYAARAAYIGGFDSTSNVMAGLELGIPVVGTAAHAYTMAFDDEEEAFAHYLKMFPESTTLLIDTYDTERGTRRAAALGKGVKGVRLDSGDLGQGAKKMRQILDEAGLDKTEIVVSSDLNEYRIAELEAQGAPIDAYGVGTELVTSRDDPTLPGVYKLVQKLAAGGEVIPTMKFSASKRTYPGLKDLYRVCDRDGTLRTGALAQMGEDHGWDDLSAEDQLLCTYVKDGAFVETPEPLERIRARTLKMLERLPQESRAIDEGRHASPTLRISPLTLARMEACTKRMNPSE